MKKSLTIIIVGVAALTSCSKKADYVCNCEYVHSIDNVVQEQHFSSFDLIDEKKKDAEEICTEKSSSSSSTIRNRFRSHVSTCALK